MNETITLNFYDADDEIIATHSKSVISWEVLKRAIMIAERIDEEGDYASFFTEIESIICFAFGDKFAPADLSQADVGDVISTFQQIANRATMVKNDFGVSKRAAPKTIKSKKQ